MRNLTQISLLLMAMMVALTGCDAAKDAASGMADKAGGLGDMADMANMDFGSFDMAGMKEKIAGVTEGFSNVNEENADELAEKVTELDGAVGAVDTESLPAPAKTAISGVMTKLADTIQTSMDGISDEGIMGKLKPVVEPLLEKLKTF